jgi:replicative superfamily II helicase
MILEKELTGLPDGCHLNPMQELLVPHINEHYNIVVAAPTASGKSQAITMFGYKHLRNKKRVLYIGIMRALAQEKFDDWQLPTHPWSKYAKTVISGDYRMDTDKQKEIDAAEIICITPESLASRLRHPHSPRNQWLHEVGILIVDECHLLSADDRGTNMEAALIEFTYEFPDVQLIGLSATLPNVDEIGHWFTILNNKETYVIESEYRPVVLEKHFMSFSNTVREAMEEEKLAMIDQLVCDEKPDQQFLICVWQKTWGKKIEEYLSNKKVPVAFHNANYDKGTRKNIEQSFKDGRIRVLISTSTLFTGVNLPARNVIITAVDIARMDIPVYELQQAMGRAGRPKYDTEGDVYIMVPSQRFSYHQRRILTGEPVRSVLHKEEWLAMHFLGAQYLGRIDNFEGFNLWFNRTLTQYQNNFPKEVKESMLSNILDDMRMRRMIMYDDYTKHFRLAHRGKIAAQMYMDPYHFSDALINLSKYFSLVNPNDMDLAVALGSCRKFSENSISNREKLAIPDEVLLRQDVLKAYIKSISVIWYRINGKPVPELLSNVNFKIFDDFPRLHAAVARANNEVERWKSITPEKLDILFMRVILKCSEEQAELGLKKFTSNERKKLLAVGIYSVRDAMNNLGMVLKVIPHIRCIELGLIKAGAKPPTVNSDGVVEYAEVSSNRGFVGKRGFGKR